MSVAGCVLVGLTTLVSVVACGSDDEGADDGSNNVDVGASGGFGNGDGGPGSSSGQPDGAGGCATTQRRAEKVPVDMVLALDTSFSMDFLSKWVNVRDAMKAFVNNPAYRDLGIGLQFFPIRKQCSVADYQLPAVPLTLQPQAAAPIGAALDAQEMAGGTPMVPLLQGLTNYLTANAKPGRKPVIVLTTDGIPDLPADTCQGGPVPNTLDNAVLIAGNAFKQNPPITTFVIGVGNELKALDAIAAAGGTGTATLVDTGGNAQQALLTALDTIRRSAIPCDYDIPGGTIDVNATNVTYTSAGATKSLVYVANAAGCAKAPGEEGWYFDNEAAPKKVILCGKLCEAVKKDDLGSVDLVFGCPRVDVK